MTGTAPTSAGVLVVGAGQAAVQLASTLREAGYEEPITLVGDHLHPPYQRPPLSKGFLKGTSDADSLAFRAVEFYEERGIRLVLGDSVTGVERDEDGSGWAVLASGVRLPFGRLVLATGAAVRRLPLEGADAPGVEVLGSLDDAHQLLAALDRAEDVVVIGGGFVGLEVAATARGLGRSVVVVEAGPQLLGRAVGPTTARHVQGLHEAEGITVLLDARPRAIVLTDGSASGVELEDGTVLPAQLVVIGVGSSARTELAESLGLRCAGGVLVDEHSVASDGTTLAIGDCAVVPDPTPGGAGDPRRLESVDNAVEQAKAAASTIMGDPVPYRSVPWFWSDQGDVKLQIAGLRSVGDVEVVRRLEDPARLVVACYRDGALVAVEAVGSPADFMVLKRALVGGWEVDPAAVLDTATALKSSVTPAPRPLPAG